MKKSFILLTTLILTVLFTYILVNIMHTKSLQNKTLQNQYLYIQAKNHLNFLQEYVKSIDLKDINTINIDDDFFDIFAQINSSKIQLFVKSKSFDIALHKTITK